MIQVNRAVDKTIVIQRNSNGYLATPHVKARTEKFSSYPDRFLVPEDKVPFEESFPEYNPQYYLSDVVIKKHQKYLAGTFERVVDPENIRDVKRKFTTYESAEIRLDSNGYPLNPRGRTGLRGRGVLEKWGANFAADPIITRLNTKTGQFEMLAIKRKDNGQWAIPGGKVDEGERISKTAARELGEESGVELNMDDAVLLYQGYVDDPRNTDNAWFETSVFHKYLPNDLASRINPKAGTGEEDVAWMPLTEGNINNLYASHGSFVRLALLQLTENK